MPIKLTKNYGGTGFTLTGGEFPIQGVTDHDVGKVIGIIQNPDGSLEYGLLDANYNDFVITFSGTGDSTQGTATCDRTWEEVIAAYSAGKNIKCQYVTAEQDKQTTLPTLEISLSTGTPFRLMACTAVVDDVSVTNLTCVANFDNFVQINIYSYSVNQEE